MASRDEPQAPGIVRTHMLGPDASGTTGRSLGEPGSAVDHVLKPSRAQLEGMPEPEEDRREEEDTHGHVNIEHEIAAPLIPHETMEPQRGAEDAD